MLVAISGSQGSGKSTILRTLKEKGFNIIERKTSRSILQDWDVTLEQVNNDALLTLDFQEEITRRKFEDEEKAVHSSELWFTERTHADLFTYSLISLGKDNTYSEWIDNYYLTCMHHNQHYKSVYYLRAGQFKIEHDGTRNSNSHYSRMVDLTMLDMTQQMVHNSKLTVIETSDLTQRVGIISTQSQQLLQDQNNK